jgi:saccharopine dehydrogenase (NADP+, L-glutamate forming)
MSGSKKILVLGSGMVAPPCVEYLARDPNNQITIGEESVQWTTQC